MKKYLYSIIIALCLTSCSAPKLYQQGLDKINKAIEKDPSLSFPTDTLRLIEHDTIPGVDGKDSIIRIKETIEIPCDFDIEAFKEATRNKTRRELRFERKMYKDSLRHNERMYKLQTNRLEDSLQYLNKLNKELTKQIRDTNDKEEKLAKEETKQKKGNWLTRFLGRNWWLVLILGLIGGFYIRGFIPTLPNIFKRNGS